MNLEMIRKHYDKLTDAERFRLAMAAEVREDYAEARRLNGAAPRAAYWMTELPYGQMRDALLICAMAAAVEMLQICASLASQWGIYLARDHSNWDEDAKAEAYVRLQDMAKAMLARWEALPLFAQDIGLDLEHVLYMVPERVYIDLNVLMAERVLEMEERYMQLLIDDIPDAVERDKVRAERVQRLAMNRREAARMSADTLVELWRTLLRL